MGLFDKLASAVKNFDYEGAADSLRNEYERKQSSIERSAHNKFRDKARNATDDEKPSVQHMVFGTKLIERETT
ncbi:hypothetical protein [Mediterraneibacter faecis]|uniref:hypothetical protein n=1 Tax=Mediterraneibacter faecis TaxID=592978 RepID=UPI0022DE9C4A|nr:hypothetical protein [Mediterraneibacter faecis]